MTMSSGLRKLTLTVHLITSVGWLGAVAAYLPFDIAVVASQDPSTVRGAYMAMGTIVTWIIVPFALASLLTGLIVSLGTRWGLFRHYWVLISFLLTTIATVFLLMEAPGIADLRDLAADPAASGEDLLARGSTLVHSIGGMVVLLAVMVLNVYKPRGMTRYGWRKTQEGREQRRVSAVR